MASRTKSSISYSQSGVNYSLVDPYKIVMQNEGEKTAKILGSNGFQEGEGTRGETAYVVDIGDQYIAMTMEGLGSKSLITQELFDSDNPSLWEKIGQDAVASIINDLIAVGATPVALSAYWSMHSYDWFNEDARAKALIKGWSKACELAEVSWGGGETQSLPDIIIDEKIELAGSAVGIIKPKNRFASQSKLTSGDVILLAESSGIHANGLSLVRKLSTKLAAGYMTQITEDKTFGEAVLEPTYIYTTLIRSLFEAAVDIHYMVHITGHGWRKLMRADRDFRYSIEQVPKPQQLFLFMQKELRYNDREMYGTFNMGAGFAFFVPEKDVKRAEKVGKKVGFPLLRAGYVEKGAKQVVIKPKNITFQGDTLGVR